MSCQTSATGTLFTTITGSTVITSSSSSVTTLPGTTSTILSTSCLLTATSTGNSTTIAAADGICASSTIITSTTVIDGGVSTVQVPFEVTSVFTSTQATRTLFSECTTTEANNQDTSTTTTSTSTTSPPTTTTTSPTSTTSSTTSTTDAETTIFSDQTFTTLSTPTTTLTTSQDSTLADGQITQILVTVTSVLDPTSVVQTSQVAIQTNTSGGDSSSSSNVGAIAGGVVGGFVGLLAKYELLIIINSLFLCFVFLRVSRFFSRRRRNWDDIFEKDYEEYMKPQPVQRGHMLDMEDEPIRAAAVNDEPKPYVYGLVGSANTPAPNTLGVGLAAVSPSAPQNRLSTGSGSINANSINTLSQQQHYHNRTPSETPLMMGGMMSNRSGPNTPGSRSSIGPGLSPSPSLAPSVNGARTGSPSPGPGPLGVLINTGPSLSMAESGFGLGSGFEHEHEKEHGNGNDSPTSVAPPRGALFITNQTEESNVTPPGSPVPRSKSPGSPGSPGVGRSSLSMVINGSEFTASATAASPTVSSAASAIPARVREEEDGLQHNASVSSQSVYSQASGSTVQQMPVGLREAIRQSQIQSQGRTGSGTGTGTGVFVHTDGGRVDLSGEPPSYKNS